jgi:hypothetical protein
VTVTKILKCSVEMLEVLREDLFCGAYDSLAIPPQIETVRTSYLVPCWVEHNTWGHHITKLDKYGATISFVLPDLHKIYG